MACGGRWAVSGVMAWWRGSGVEALAYSATSSAAMTPEKVSLMAVPTTRNLRAACLYLDWWGGEMVGW